jgi:hypothetical protein
MKIKFTSVIPTVQYGNIQPEIEVEADDYEGALLLADEQIAKLWDRYYNKIPSNKTIKLVDYFGQEIDYEPSTHTYSWNGERFVSGSEYAEEPFDGAAIATKMAEKVGAKASDILKMWSLKGEASRNFGDSIHKAMQLYEQYGELSKRLGKTYHLHDNYMLQDAVESFYKAHTQKAVSEILITDREAKRAGRVDRLEILGDKHGRVADFKTGKVSKKLPSYFKQCNFYSDIFVAHGWKMEPPIIYGWDGKWVEYVN